jgi:integrase
MSRTAIPAEKTLASHVESFLAQKKAAATAGELSANRVYILRLHLEHFRDWRAGESAVTDIDGKSLADYRLELLRRVESKEWSRTTANDRLTSVKSFVRWLWQIEAIPSLPRIIDSNTLRIGKQLPSVVTLTKPEISTLLKAASDRTKLYLLLMLNTGMTQKDIADLQLAEVDWEHGRITRKRSKTKRFSNVPIVTYTLWAETRRLLAQERNPADTGNVLLNQNGGPLWYEEVDDKGRLKKNDNIKNAFGRVARKQKITKPLKCLRKTSANLLRGSGTYASLAPVFLGHAPTAVADKHYTRPPQDLFDEAVRWLAQEYGQ